MTWNTWLHRISITIRSKHCQIIISKSKKESFNDLTTLHAIIEEPKDKNFVGTEFILNGVTEKDTEDTKKTFS